MFKVILKHAYAPGQSKYQNIPWLAPLSPAGLFTANEKPDVGLLSVEDLKPNPEKPVAVELVPKPVVVVELAPKAAVVVGIEPNPVGLVKLDPNWKPVPNGLVSVVVAVLEFGELPNAKLATDGLFSVVKDVGDIREFPRGNVGAVSVKNNKLLYY